jgi:NADH-quinone oxidoreductase subunit M
MFENMRLMVLMVLALPLVAAVVVAALGPRNRDAVRWIALATVLINLVVTGILTFDAASSLKQKARQTTSSVLHDESRSTFEPEYVPGESAHSHRTTWNLFEIPAPSADGRTTAIQLYLGVDGLNIWLILLTSLLMVPSVLVSWESIKERANEFYAWLLVLQFSMLGVFLAFDVIVFYVFFELTLVPLFFLIGIWGGPSRREAARKFFLYTLAGSLFTLLGLIGLVLACKERSGELTFSIPKLTQVMQHQLSVQDGLIKNLNDELAMPTPASGEYSKNARDFAVDLNHSLQFWRTAQTAIFLALALGFAVKVPLFPLHTWLPLAHTEAPTAGSVLLAGVLLKLGSYGFLRLCLPLVPDASLSIGMPLIGTLASIGIIYGALCAFAQADIKKMVAYSSVSHMGFCVLGLFALNATGITGGLMQMINHGLSTGGLFLLVGMLYDRYHTRMMPDFGGLAARLKLLSLAMVLICLSSVGMPFLNGFVGEMMVLAGVMDINSPTCAMVFGAVGAASIVLGAWYLFTMLQRVFFGPLKEPHHDPNLGPILDLKLREIAALLPIIGACLFIGIYPQPLLDATKRDIAVLSRIADDARARSEQTKSIVPAMKKILSKSAEAR